MKGGCSRGVEVFVVTKGTGGRGLRERGDVIGRIERGSMGRLRMRGGMSQGDRIGGTQELYKIK
jgi:hypothetical protein